MVCDVCGKTDVRLVQINSGWTCSECAKERLLKNLGLSDQSPVAGERLRPEGPRPSNNFKARESQWINRLLELLGIPGSFDERAGVFLSTDVAIHFHSAHPMIRISVYHRASSKPALVIICKPVALDLQGAVETIEALLAENREI